MSVYSIFIGCTRETKLENIKNNLLDLCTLSFFFSHSGTHPFEQKQMINDNPAYPSSTENGNPIHQSSSDNLTHQQPSSDNLAQFIRMLGNISPADRQTLASALSSSPSPETDSDPFLSTKPAVKTLEPYNRLEEWLPSFKKRDEFFNHTKTHELEDYADVKQFHRVQHLEYTAPPLTSSRDVNVHKRVYKRDQDMAIIQARLAHLTRPIDATVHAILACHPMDIEDPVLINTIETFDILRYNLVFIATEITHLRKKALYRDKKIIPPADPERQDFAHHSSAIYRPKESQQFSVAASSPVVLYVLIELSTRGTVHSDNWYLGLPEQAMDQSYHPLGYG
ncbi:hypothetical protein BKA57DRAFT_520864 [Linnemannia elongata]|nr:hypothetical protein BKA57DRAFT_520864 [Linnemannia elongata]